MKNNFFKKLFFTIPILILIIMLFLIDNTVNYFKDTTYTFVYDTNVESVQRFSRELDELISEGYTGKEYSELYLNMIKAHTKTNGEEYAIISFLLDEDTNIFYGIEQNQAYVSQLLENPNNQNTINEIATTHGTGEVILDNQGKPQTWFYQLVSDGDKDYYEFMSVDRTKIENKLDTNKIIIPIVIIGFILILIVEYLIWLKIDCNIKKVKAK